ncbi:MAG TPA: GNAT family N-acetyltransferase [Chryseolinea sp.]|nr:GNAT family N-acetyltransferase [Chryseolinea sp.]
MKYLLEEQETKRILFRKVSLLDFDDWLEFHKDPITSQHWISELEAPEVECEKWYAKQFYRYENNLGGMNALISKESGKLMGHCGLLVQTVDGQEELEIGYSLLPSFWNKGIATEAAEKCKNYAFENNFAESLISIISVTNKPSSNVAVKNGMRLVKITNYNGNKVDIFRIEKTNWGKCNSIETKAK